MKKVLEIKNLCASVDGKQILNGVSFRVGSGQVHAIMGPNGSGKSTLANVFLGHPAYKIQNQKSTCHIKIGEKNILDLPPEERARAGLFLAFQSPITLPGVTVVNLLRCAYQAIHGQNANGEKKIHNPFFARRLGGNGIGLLEFTKKIKEYAAFLHIEEPFLHRGIGEGFSGGEKKKMEMLQALVLAPKFAIFDEIDTGLDVDALVTVAAGIGLLKKQGTGVIIITHYQRILKYVKPDVVHILIQGKIMKTGDAKLARLIEKEGYKKFESRRIEKRNA